MRVAIVAGELSGDRLGAGLIRALRKHWPTATFEGIGGPAMQAEGFESLYPMEKLSVMGLVEVVRHLPELLGIRRELANRYTTQRPDVFIGIDSPDFNLGLEQRLRRAGVKTVHYVSPTIWAWRRGRLRTVRRAVDLMLALFPFEAQFYEQVGVPAAYVGHPAADRYPLVHDVTAARARLDLNGSAPVVALLPGSRRSEVMHLAPEFATAVAQLHAELPECRFVAAMATPELAVHFREVLDTHGLSERVQVLEGQSDAAMGAADVVLAASGTVTLEAMLLKRPTVVAYKVAPVTHWLLRRMIRVNYIALPNLLANAELMPELIQNEATGQRMAEAVTRLLRSREAARGQQARWDEIHRILRRDADTQAAEAIVQCLR